MGMVIRPNQVSPEDSAWEAQTLELVVQLERSTGYPVQLIEYSESEFQALVNRGARLVTELSDTGMVVTGELELARQHGRWLSDDERADLLLREQGRAKRRRTLLLLAALSLLIPLFWPLLPLWLGLIWWPVTTRRLLMVLVGGVGALLALLVLLVLWLLLR